MLIRHGVPGWIAALAVAALLVPAAAFAQEVEAETEPRRIEVTILGMSCPFCAYGVEQKLKRVEGVEDLEVDLKTGIATLILAEGADVSNATLKETVEEAGFEVAAIERTFESEHPDLEPQARGGDGES